MIFSLRRVSHRNTTAAWHALTISRKRGFYPVCRLGKTLSRYSGGLPHQAPLFSFPLSRRSFFRRGKPCTMAWTPFLTTWYSATESSSKIPTGLYWERREAENLLRQKGKWQMLSSLPTTTLSSATRKPSIFPLCSVWTGKWYGFPLRAGALTASPSM